MDFTPITTFFDTYTWAATLIGLTLLALACWLLDYLFQRWLIRGVAHVAERTTTLWDDALIEQKVFARLAHLVPAAFAQLTLPLIPHLEPALVTVGRNVATAYMVLTAALACSGALSAVHVMHNSGDTNASLRPIKGYLQLAKMAVFLVSAVLIVSILIERSPLLLLSGLGAMTAVLLLVFKDTLLSLVASVQIASNDIVRVGDWIEMPDLKADGDVIDIALHTVKVQNWDKTITTIPTQRLITDSFRNWRGMSEGGARRVKRSLLIDQSSIRFLEAEDIERLLGLDLLKPYLERKLEELKQHNAEHNAHDERLPNGRRLTNIGTYRAYAQAYIENHPDIHPQRTRLVRALDPAPSGIPIEIYCFTRSIVWLEHERVRGDLFDHLMAILPLFDLRLYQNAAGHDLRQWSGKGVPEARTETLNTD